MTVEIDKKSGFCFGVVYAIQMAEDNLKNNDKLYCLGDIVHNNMEVDRLKRLGLESIDHEQLKNLRDCKVLIRAHGEPPETYRIAHQNNIELLDASCPVVLKLQNRIKEGYSKADAENAQIVIYGKQGHAEVKGLLGQTEGKAIVINSKEEIDKIDFKRPIRIYSQTTQSKDKFKELQDEIKKRAQAEVELADDTVIGVDTICRQVSGREPDLEKFAAEKDIIIFVSGRKSSNGKILYNVCKDVNPRSYFVSNQDELEKDWFKPEDNVGICGATSTPRWLMDKVSEKIEAFMS